MKTNEHDYYSELANWSFEDIDYTSEVFIDWIYEDEIKKRVNENTRILDLGTAAGEKVLKKFPDCAEILGTDFSNEKPSLFESSEAIADMFSFDRTLFNSSNKAL